MTKPEKHFSTSTMPVH
jgi:hypothetical protein